MALSPQELLERIPHREPFRFVDEILAVDEQRILASYCWREDAEFYRGHFPGHPVTPGVLLVESMAQAGVVAHGIFLLAKEGSSEPLENLITVFTDAQVEFRGPVAPGERVLIKGQKLFFRRRKLRSEVEMQLLDGTLVCCGVLSGIGIPR